MEKEEEKKEKVTIKESELTKMIQAETRKGLEEFAKKELDEKIDILLEEQKNNFGEYAKDQTKEQMQDLVSQFKLDPEVQEAEKKAEQFKSFGEFLLATRRFRINRELDQRLSYINNDGKVDKTAGHMEIADDSQGGFLVPEAYRADLQMIALENAIVRPNGATIIPPIKSDSVKIPYVNDTSHATTVFGGVQAAWTAEREAKDATKPTFGQMELIPKKLAGITYTSNELLMDSAIALEPLIKRMFGSAWGYFEDNAFINGNGVGQPLGIQNCNALKVVLRNTVNRVFFEDLREMYACMLGPSHPFAIWVLNPGVLPDLIGMTSGDVAPAAATTPIWINQNMGAANPIPGRIFGRPFFISEKMPSLGTQGDIGYFDLRYYFIFDRQPLTIDVSTHVAFTTDETCWRFVLRVAGQCWPAATLTPRNAAAPVTTISPFVVLGATTS